MFPGKSIVKGSLVVPRLGVVCASEIGIVSHWKRIVCCCCPFVCMDNFAERIIFNIY
jgi:hypothetical protein